MENLKLYNIDLKYEEGYYRTKQIVIFAKSEKEALAKTKEIMKTEYNYKSGCKTYIGEYCDENQIYIISEIEIKEGEYIFFES